MKTIVGGAPQGLRLSLLMTPVGPEPSTTSTTWAGTATAEADLDGLALEVASISFEFHSVRDESVQDLDLWGDASIGYMLAFDVPRVDRRFQATDVDLALVAGLMAGLSSDRAVGVTLVAEPRGWQSLKLSRREAEVATIAKRWQRLGFGPYLSAYSCQPETVARVARGYEPPPELAMRGDGFDWTSAGP